MYGMTESSVHYRELNTLYKVAEVICETYGQHQMLQAVLQTLQDSLGMYRGTVMLLSQDADELIVEATGYESEDKSAVKYKIGEGITGRVLQTGKPAIIPRIADEPNFRSRIHSRDEIIVDKFSFICVPIQVAHESVGTLSADMPFESEAILKMYQKVLSIVAGMIAGDVKNRRLAKLEKRALREENIRLRTQLGQSFKPGNMLGNSGGMMAVYEKITQVAQSNTTVLIRGESGTGKELVAACLHYNSNRSEKPYIKVNCAALNENLLESELFGHEKGAFTGALTRRKGRIEEADGGTLFLDEIGEFSPSIQVKMLRILQEKEIERVGSNETIKVDVRIIAATNRDLEADVKKGTFRSDLYYRINVFPICLPPLRERKDDILLLADFFTQKFAAKLSKKISRISTNAINMMMSYHWPGNVRELENCIEYAVILSNDDIIHGYNLPPTLQIPVDTGVKPVGTLKSRALIFEKEIIIETLKKHSGRITAASNELGISSRMLRYKIDDLHIDYKKFFDKTWAK